MSAVMGPDVQQRQLTVMMVALFVGYMMVVYIRESVTFSAPFIAKSEQLDTSDLGWIVSSQKFGYTLIKFVAGPVVDMFNPGLVFSTSLALSGLVGASFAACSSVAMFSAVWFVCGLVQGPAWPACGVLLKNSVSPRQFATWWSVLSTSTNVAGVLGPLLAQSLNSVYPWRLSFLLAGAVSVIMGAFCGLLLMSFKTSQGKENSDTGKKGESKELPFSLGNLLSRELLVVYLVYFLCSMVRGVVNDWSQQYLIEEKQHDALTGSRFMSCQQVGGMLGSLVAGYLADTELPKGQHRAMPRIQCQCLFSFLQTVGVYCLVYHVNAQSSQVWMGMVGFFIGFSLFGCIILVGVIAMELAPHSLSGTSHSMGTLAGNVGRVIAGYPFALIATHVSWHAGFLTAVVVSLASVGASFLLRHLVQVKHSSDDAVSKDK